MKTAELTGAALDWAVAKCEGAVFHLVESFMSYQEEDGMFMYSVTWSQGGPIIERERLCVMPYNDSWTCATNGDHLQSHSMHGDTPLEAAMRCYVASKLGDEVEIPAELTR